VTCYGLDGPRIKSRWRRDFPHLSRPTLGPTQPPFCRISLRLCTAGRLWTNLCVSLQWGWVMLADCELNCVSGCSEIMYCWRTFSWTLCLVAMRLCTAGGLWTKLCVGLLWVYVILADFWLNAVSGCNEVMYYCRIFNWTVCLFAIRLCRADGLWTELCVLLRWGKVLLADFVLNCASVFSEVIYCCRISTEPCCGLQCGYICLAVLDCIVCLVSVNLCTPDRSELNCVSGCNEVMYCWRVLNWTVCLVALKLCTTSGLWSELCVSLQVGYVMLADSELNCVSFCSEVVYYWRIFNWTVSLVAMRLCSAGGFWTELCVLFQWCFVLLAVFELNCVSVCSDVMYCWLILNWTECLVALRLCTAGELWPELYVWLQRGYVLLTYFELKCVSV